MYTTPAQWMKEYGGGLIEILIDQEKGSSMLLEDVLNWLTEHPEALSVRQADTTLRALQEARPAMACFEVLSERLSRAWRLNPDRAVGDVVEELHTQLRAADDEAAKRWCDVLNDARRVRVITLSFSSTVVKALQAAADRLGHVYVLLSEPGGEGGLLAAELEGVCPVSLHEDEELETLAGKADLALIGADTVYGDGSVLNKVMSRPLAEAMHELGKPFYVVATRWKESTYRWSEELIDPETSFESVPPDWITDILKDGMPCT